MDLNSTGSIEDLKIRKIYQEDILDAAHLHLRVFPNYFLSNMGLGFLSLYYRQFLNYPGFGVVAIYKDRLVGSVLGTIDAKELNDRFFKQNFFKLSAIVTKQLITNKSLRRMTISRSRFIIQALSSFLRLGNNQHTNQTTQGSAIRARLLSIGIDPELRGKGIADSMVEYYCHLLAEFGIDKVGLSVLINNHRAIHFYYKSGWQLDKETKDSIYFFREIQRH